jgi:formate dehydrogenase iron-sulfur subunit
VALPLQERAMESDSAELVRLTLIEGGASPQLAASLIPTRPLAPGEQYRFHFDMTKCIGCRSCEVACNEQNGNPADIKWRRVGELEGGVYPHVSRTYLSMGCNHCLSADCLRGCPVNAYSKDPLTGIVLHSADACIGCQYCVWNCPYSVPQFNPERGVVGKCDMCRERLLDGREPACVNACPEDAIQIEIVNKIAWSEDFSLAESPGMPAAGQTISTTRITLPQSTVAEKTWLDRVDTGNIALEHAHPSLVLMTTAMQACFGLLCGLVAGRTLNAMTLLFLLLLTVVALNVSVFHLGRPAYAWRALKMWRRSWLSREVLCFTLFFGFVAAATFAAPLAWAAIAAGAAGTYASASIYLVKARPSWNMVHTPLDFFLSSALVGVPLLAVLVHPARWITEVLHRHGVDVQPPHAAPHPHLLAIIACAWILNHVVRVARLRVSTVFERRASFHHLRGERLWWCLALSWICALQAMLFLFVPLHGMTLLSLLAATSAVLMSRYLFFVSVVPLSMGLTFIRDRGTHARAAA